MPKGIAVDNQGRIRERAAMSDTNLLLTITVLVFFAVYGAVYWMTAKTYYKIVER